ncbi:MAG: ribosome recycling factor, partial [Deltaproteobacteria bacterium]|nr:ribosome recycling factor [Deltaproteobacteria bacterium]
MPNKMYDGAKQKMERALAAFRQELAQLRTGRASLSMIENVRAEYYGSVMPLNQMATLSLPDARTIAIQPWDTSAAQAIEKAIQTSGLGLNPVNDGKMIRINIPTLTE